MSRRIEVELTSSRDDGSWTWRAAGAKQPKGTLDGALLYEGAEVGDVVRAEAEFLLDGIDIIEVLPAKGARKQPDLLEVFGSGRFEGGVTSQLVDKKRGRRDRGDRSERGEGGGRGDRNRGDRNRGDRPSRDRKPRRDGDRPRNDRRNEREKAPAKPKPKRLRPGRTHRNAAVAALNEEMRPIADQVLRGGVPSVRQEVEKQNEVARAAGQPEIKPDVLLAVAENLNPQLKAAEWRDRAEAALVGVDEIDLRDIRSVVVAADSAGRDEDALTLAEDLRNALTARVDNEQKKWLAELAQTIADGRTVRALRLSSRPPKAGAPLPPDMAERLAAAASASLTTETSQDRWATVLDAVAYSPVRSHVTPEGLPASPNESLVAAVKKLSSRLPEIAKLFGIEPEAPRKRRSRGGAKKAAARPTPPPPPPVAPEAVQDAAAEGAETIVEAAGAPVEAPVEAAAPPTAEAPLTEVEDTAPTGSDEEE